VIIKFPNEFLVRREFLGCFTVVRQFSYFWVIIRPNWTRILEEKVDQLQVELLDFMTKVSLEEEPLTPEALGMTPYEFEVEICRFVVNGKPSNEFMESLRSFTIDRYHRPFDVVVTSGFLTKIKLTDRSVTTNFGNCLQQMVNRSVTFVTTDHFFAATFRKVKSAIILVISDTQSFNQHSNGQNQPNSGQRDDVPTQIGQNTQQFRRRRKTYRSTPTVL
jgi:hypothetical protein